MRKKKRGECGWRESRHKEERIGTTYIGTEKINEVRAEERR